MKAPITRRVDVESEAACAARWHLLGQYFEHLSQKEIDAICTAIAKAVQAGIDARDGHSWNEAAEKPAKKA